MIDICIVIHKNYNLLKLQINHWKRIKGDFRVLYYDNTPAHLKLPLDKIIELGVSLENYFTPASDGSTFDGESHGGGLDFVARKTTSKHIGICDSDFFWLKSDIISLVEEKLNAGIQCIGAEPWYDDFINVNNRYPERASFLAPSVFGMFLDRDLALSETFVVTREEGSRLCETGWRLREKIIKNKIPCEVLRAFKPTSNASNKLVSEALSQAYYFGTQENPMGIHLLKGSALRSHLDAALPVLIDTVFV